FKNRDLSEFNQFRAPMTAAKQDVIEASRSPLEEWIKEGIADRHWPFNREIVVIRHLKKVCPKGLERYGDSKWASVLRKSGAYQHPTQVKLSDRSRVKMWFIGEKKDILKNSGSSILQEV